MPQKKLRCLTELAILLALTLVLDKLVIFQLPQGGSVSLGMLPIILFSLRQGLIRGLVLGGLAGLLQIILGGYFLNPLQVFLDYILAYASLASAGLWQRQSLKVPHLILATLFASSLRLLAHLAAGILFYGSFAPKGTAVWLYALTYNASFIIPSAILTSFSLILLHKKNPKLFSL